MAGIPDMLQLLVKLTQSMMAERLMFINELQATVLEVRTFLNYSKSAPHICAAFIIGLMRCHCAGCCSGDPSASAAAKRHSLMCWLQEVPPGWACCKGCLSGGLAQVKVIEGLGTTMDVVLVNGLLKEGAQIVVCGLGAPIVTTIRSLLTPHPMKASLSVSPLQIRPLPPHAEGQFACRMYAAQQQATLSSQKIPKSVLECGSLTDASSLSSSAIEFRRPFSKTCRSCG